MYTFGKNGCQTQIQSGVIFLKLNENHLSSTGIKNNVRESLAVSSYKRRAQTFLCQIGHLKLYV